MMNWKKTSKGFGGYDSVAVFLHTDGSFVMYRIGPKSDPAWYVEHGYTLWAPIEAPTQPLKNELTITITGGAGTGKSTVAKFIARALIERGFDVEVDDEDINNLMLIGWNEPQKFENTLKMIGARTEVLIETVQAARSASEK